MILVALIFGTLILLSIGGVIAFIILLVYSIIRGTPQCSNPALTIYDFKNFYWGEDIHLVEGENSEDVILNPGRYINHIRFSADPFYGTRGLGGNLTLFQVEDYGKWYKIDKDGYVSAPLFGGDMPAAASAFGSPAASTSSIFGSPAASTSSIFNDTNSNFSSNSSNFSWEVKHNLPSWNSFAKPAIGINLPAINLNLGNHPYEKPKRNNKYHISELPETALLGFGRPLFLQANIENCKKIAQTP